MAKTVDQGSAETAESGLDLVKIIRENRRIIVRVTLGATLAALLLGGINFFWLQTVRRSAVLAFRPTFEGADQLMYPNGLRFSPADVTATTVVEQVFDSNNVQQYCDRRTFRSAVFVDQYSAEFSFLDSEYQNRLAETRLTEPDRDRLKAEYAAKRGALPLRYRLHFAQPQTCSTVPPAVVSKVLSDILSTWAADSESKRGVLSYQVSMLSPAIFDSGNGTESRLIRADRLRISADHVVANLNEVIKLPGAHVVRSASEGLTFADLAVRASDLGSSRIEPLVLAAARSMGRDATDWVETAAANVRRDLEQARAREQAYRDALRENAGSSQAAMTASSGRSSTGSSDTQGISPQIDKSFIDRILQLAEATSGFRQDLSKKMINEGLRAAAIQGRLAYYDRVAQAVPQQSGPAIPVSDIEAQLKAVADDGRKLVKDFNLLYEQYSASTLRATSSLFQQDAPVVAEVSRTTSLREYLASVIAAMFVAFIAAMAFVIVRERVSSSTSPAKA